MANSYTTRVFPQPDIRSPHAQPAGSNSSFSSTSLASSVLHTPVASSSLTSTTTSHLTPPPPPPPPTATPPHLSSSPSSSPSLSTPSSSPTLSSSHTKLQSPSDHIYKPALSQSQSTFFSYDNSGFDINTLVDAALSQAKLDPEVVVAAAQLCRLANGRWESSSSLYFSGGSNSSNSSSNSSSSSSSSGGGGGGNGGGMNGVNNFNGINGVNNNNIVSNLGGLNSGANGNACTLERNSKPNGKSPSVMALSNLLLPDETEFATQSVYDYA